MRLADSLLLPLNCSDYAEVLEEYVKTAEALYQEQLSARKISMGTNRPHSTDDYRANANGI